MILVRRASRLALFTPTNHVGFSLAARHRRWSGDHCGGLCNHERLVPWPLVLPSGSPLFRPFWATIELTLVPHTSCFTFLHHRSHDSDGSAVLRCKSPSMAVDHCPLVHCSVLTPHPFRPFHAVFRSSAPILSCPLMRRSVSAWLSRVILPFFLVACQR